MSGAASRSDPTHGDAVAIGVFDGLHLGHRAILERALAMARSWGGRAIVLSFDPHPDVVLRKGPLHIPAPLTPELEKRARLTSLGVDVLEVLPFTREMASLAPEEFVTRHVTGPYAPHAVVVGEGFALGRGRSGDVRRLGEIGRKHGFVVEAVPLALLDGEPVSSTRIRGALAQGRVDLAARLLGRRYTLTGRVVTGAGMGRKLGYPTANLRLHEEKLLPADGIYAARAGIGDETPHRPAAMSIGMRPTFDGTVRTLEAHLIDFDAPLVGQDLTVEFVDWLRPEVRFDGAAALTAAIGADVEATRRRLAALAPGEAG
jgi:riboflavin kinase/FMN adenylyltransferase